MRAELPGIEDAFNPIALPSTLRDMDRSPSFLQTLEALTQEDYVTALKVLGGKFLFTRHFDYEDEAHRVGKAYPAFDAAIHCHAPDPNQDFDDDMGRSLMGIELSAVFLANLLENRPDGDPLKTYLLGINPAELETATKSLFSVPLDALTERTRDWPSRFPPFSAFLAGLCSYEDDGLLLHGALVLLIAVIDLAQSAS